MLQRRALWLAVAVLAAGAVTSARQTTAASAPLDVIRLGVIVSDQAGRPVRELTRDDFDVFAGPTRLRIDAFREVTVEPDDDPSADLPAGVLRSVGRNTYVTDPRLLVIVLDDVGLSEAQATAARARLTAVIASIEPDVPIGLAFSSGAPGVELSLDRVRLASIVERLAAGARGTAEGDVLDVLSRTAARLGSATRNRRAVLWMTAGGGGAGFDEVQVRRLLDAAGEGGVSVYSASADGQAALRRNAEVAPLVAATGGVAFGTAPPADIAAAIQSDLTHYYLLTVPATVPATSADGDGPEREDASTLQVVVGRDGAVVRVRSGYRGAPGAADVPAVLDVLDVGAVVPFADGVAPHAGVPIAVFAAPFPTGDRDVPVLVAVQMTVPVAPLRAIDPLLSDQVDWTILAVDLDTGHVSRRRIEEDTLALRPRATDPDRHEAVQYELSSWIDLRPGRYQLRVVARSTRLELAGTAFLSLDVPDFATEPISVGGIVLGHPRTEPGPASRVPVQPAFHRDFDRWEELTVFLEVGRRSRANDASALVEVFDAAGTVVHQSAPEIGGRGETPVRIDLPLNTLLPGAYRIHVRAAVGGESAIGETGFVIRGVPALVDSRAASVAAAVPVPPASSPADPPGVSGSAGAPTTLRLRPEGFDLGDSASAVSSDGPHRLARQGWDRYGQGDVESAQALLRRAVDLGSEDPWIYYALGLAEFGLLRHQEAATVWEFVRAREPAHQPVYFDLTDAYLSLDRPEDAVAVLKDAAIRWPADPDVHNAMGVVYYGRRQYDEAIAAFELAVEVAPDDGLGFFNLGQVFQARMVRWQSNRSVQMRSATRALADRDRDRAIEAYEKALTLGGSFEWDARQALRALASGGEAGRPLSAATVR